jgi:hypothetical protein
VCQGLRLLGVQLAEPELGVHEPLQFLQGGHVVGGHAFEFGGIAGWEGVDLRDVNARDMIRVDASQLRRDERAGIVAARAVAVVSEPGHQRRPRFGRAGRTPLGFDSAAGEPESG